MADARGRCSHPSGLGQRLSTLLIALISSHARVAPRLVALQFASTFGCDIFVLLLGSVVSSACGTCGSAVAVAVAVAVTRWPMAGGMTLSSIGFELVFHRAASMLLSCPIVVADLMRYYSPLGPNNHSHSTTARTAHRITGFISLTSTY